MAGPIFLAILATGCSEYSLGDEPGPEPATLTTTPASATDTTPEDDREGTLEPVEERDDEVHPPEIDPGDPTEPGDPTDPTTDEPDTPRPEGEQVDAAVQAGTFLVDVLWVVDNSCSMGDDQDSLATHFPTFIDYFETVQGLDYHVGVVSTDVEDSSHEGKLREAQGVRWLESGTPDKGGVFDAMAQMGTDGSGDEAGIAAVHLATQVHADGWNAGFFRDDAALAVIVISDEDDTSYLFGVDVQPFIADLLAFKADPAMVSFSTITGPVPNGCATADPGFGYDEVLAQVGGVFHSICAPDWDVVLEDLAATALASKREFFLAEIPDPDTLEAQVVESDGTELWFAVGADFTYDPVRNSITFTSYLPGPLAEVFIHYVPDFGSGW